MIERKDRKGKVYTERVRKDHAEVELVTTQGRIHGYVHLGGGQRLRDLLNSTSEQYLAVTDATMRSEGIPNAYPIKFIAINKHYIITVIPIQEPYPNAREDVYLAP